MKIAEVLVHSIENNQVIDKFQVHYNNVNQLIYSLDKDLDSYQEKVFIKLFKIAKIVKKDLN